MAGTLSLNPHTYMFYLSKLGAGQIPFLTTAVDFGELFSRHKFALATAALGCEIRSTPYLATAVTYIPFDATVGMLLPRDAVGRPPAAHLAVKLPHDYVFNPGLIGRRADGTYTTALQPGDDLLVAVRTSGFKWGVTTTQLILLGQDYRFKRLVGEVDVDDPWTREDVRLFALGGELCLYSSLIYDYTIGGGHKTLCSWRKVYGEAKAATDIVPPYGRPDGPEKNWGFFDSMTEGQGQGLNPLAVYSHSPTWTVIDAGTGTELIKTQMPAAVPPLNGGAPPLWWRGKWWSFCHTTVNGSAKPADSYATYVVTFEHGTWRPTAWGRLMGRGHDLGHEVNFVFVTGAVAVGETHVILAAGLNDTESVFFEFTTGELDGCLRNIHCSVDKDGLCHLSDSE